MAEYMDRAVCLSILRAKANMAVLMDAAPYFEKAAQMLEKLPAADVAPVVHGRWVPFHSEAAGDIQYCSACEIGFRDRVRGQDGLLPQLRREDGWRCGRCG